MLGKRNNEVENTTHIQENRHQFKENGVPMNGHSVFGYLYVLVRREWNIIIWIV
jgi:hypothetical protein